MKEVGGHVEEVGGHVEEVGGHVEEDKRAQVSKAYGGEEFVAASLHLWHAAHFVIVKGDDIGLVCALSKLNKRSDKLT